MKPTLFVLAAGMGSRYGGLKQLDGVGPNGETIMDYSIYDAIEGGFGKIVFVIRKDFEEDFRTKIISKYSDHLPVEVCFQGIENLPEGFVCPKERQKPWGTNHAVLMGKDLIQEPFAVINADDFYGKESFKILADKLVELEGKTKEYCMVGYRVGNTLSESGTVSRGVCSTDEKLHLTTVVERTAICRIEGKVSYKDENGALATLEDNTPVSMNMWGFTPDYFDYSEQEFIAFLKKELNTPKSEYFIPSMVNKLISEGTCTCEVLDTPSSWFGVTYAEDRPTVVVKLQKLVDAKIYPSPLF